jgi:subtilase family serine protease
MLVALSAIGGAARAAASSKTLPGALVLLRDSKNLGAAKPEMELTVHFGVQIPNRAAEQGLYRQMYDKSSPLYHHFLTVGQFNARFGLHAGTVAAIRQWLAKAGMKVQYVTGSHDFWTVTGTVARVDGWLHTRINNYAKGTTRFFASADRLTVPAALSILGFTGLDNYPTDQLAPLFSRALKGGALAAAERSSARAASSSSATTGVETTYSPQDLWKIYDYPDASSLIKANGTSDPATLENSTVPLGQGQTAGVVASGDVGAIVDQLRLFEQHWGLPKVPVKIIEVSGGPDSDYGGGGGDDAEEWSLDVQAVTGMAPDLKQLIIYDASSLDQVAWYSYWANQKTGAAQELNSSEFTCEDLAAALEIGDGNTDPSITVEEPLLEQATMEGRTLFNASGDTGSGCDGLNGFTISPNPSVGYPCSSDYDVCVGGTVLASAGATYPQASQEVSEDAWTYSGGGSSAFIPEPSFQTPVEAISTPCLFDLTTDEPYTSGVTCRGLPDVADLSGDVDGDNYFIYAAGVPSAEGGTSLASPLMVGQWASIQSAAPASVQADGGLGYADETFYKQAAGADDCDAGVVTELEQFTIGAPACTDPTYNRDFNQITEGEDLGDVTGAAGAPGPTSTGLGIGNGEYLPTPGWDFITGWGSLKVAGLEGDVDGSTVATDPYTGAEVPAKVVNQASLQSYPDSAGTEESGILSEETGLDSYAGVNVTAVTLSATSQNVTATLTVPDLSEGTPLDSTGNITYYVAWSYNDTVHYLSARESADPEAVSPLTFAYSSGQTVPENLSLSAGTGYQDNAGTSASGSANTTAGVITITAPVSAVGSPASCDLLAVPQAFVVSNEIGGENIEVAGGVQNISQFDGYSTDDGLAESVGEDVEVGGTSATCPSTGGGGGTSGGGGKIGGGSGSAGGGGTGTGGAKCAANAHVAPTATIRETALTSSRLDLYGTATAYCRDKLNYVHVVVARVVKGKCSFLHPNRVFGTLQACSRFVYLHVTSVYTNVSRRGRWTVAFSRKFAPGTYEVWVQSVDNKKLSTNISGSRPSRTLKLR